MCVKTVTKSTGALSSGESAPSIETSKTSEKKCRLLCVPTRLPETKIPKTEEYRETDKSKQAELKAYFYAAGFRRFHARRTI
jgi:hypothetical protein